METFSGFFIIIIIILEGGLNVFLFIFTIDYFYFGTWWTSQFSYICIRLLFDGWSGKKKSHVKVIY